ncbi:MAG: thioredoxin domain-containing protein [Bacteroidales bacterium]
MNRLKSEKSLYLQQHANNPVDWYPWGEEAFEKARKEGKIIIVSVGYSSCHWCHVMEKEVFERKEAADVMNADFISVKVDREERPDVDQYLMERVQALGQRGGWPLNCFLTPEGEFFFGATYFPLNQWIKLLKEIQRIFKTERHLINQQAREINQRVSFPFAKIQQSTKVVLIEIPDELPRLLARSLDSVYGGLKGAPKFPMPSLLLLSLVLSKRYPKSFPESLVDLTLSQMRAGGIYDQLNGGFFRYSVDGEWIIPHFEKMLYDNAQLAAVYAEASLIRKKPFWAETALDIITFLEKNMKSSAGGYGSAIDADNALGEGHYYTFTEPEIADAAEFDITSFRKFFRIDEKSVLENGRYVLRRPVDFLEIEGKNLSEDLSYEKINEVIRRLQHLQKSRPFPAFDTKVVVSWNAMALYALVKTWIATSDQGIFDLAVSLAEFLAPKGIDESSREVYHVVYEDEPSVTGFLEDYAWMAFAFMNFYCISAQPEYLKYATECLELAYKKFKMDEGGVLSSNLPEPPLNESVVEIHDNVTPSPNSVFCRALILAGKITGHRPYLEQADEMLNGVWKIMDEHPVFMANWWMAALERSDTALVVKIPADKLHEAYQSLKLRDNFLLTLVPLNQESSKGLYQICTTDACIFAASNWNEILLKIEDYQKL